MEKTHSGNFAGDDKMFGFCGEIGNSSDELKAIVHGNEKSSIESSFAEFF